jgi:hypothetical protein
MLHLLKPGLIDRIEESNYRFCPNPDCRVVYFAESASSTFTTDELRVRVGLKEREDPIPICYCFGHTVASARDELARTSRSTVVASITAEIKAGRCACETTNPSGSCCLGDVSKAVQELMKEMAQPINHPSETQEACCQTTARPASWLGRGLLALGVSGAALAALCCFAPALLAGLLVAIGLGFILNDAVLMALLAIFAGIAAFGYHLIKKRSAAPTAQQATPNFK